MEEFILADGKKIKNLNELKKVVPKLAIEVFSHHVNENKNDFAVWVRHSLKNKDLAEKLDKVKTKSHMVRLLRPKRKRTKIKNVKAQNNEDKKLSETLMLQAENLRFAVVEFIIGLVVGFAAGVLLASL